MKVVFRACKIFKKGDNADNLVPQGHFSLALVSLKVIKHKNVVAFWDNSQ